MSKDELKSLEGFLVLLNKDPNKHELQMNKAANNTLYLPISFLETTLDEMFFGLWKTESFTTRVIGNEIAGELSLSVFHPIKEIWITRIGAAATMIRQTSGAGIMEADKKIKNALEMDYPHLKADCFRNACLSLGKSFGRDLNRKFIDTYKAMLSSIASGEPDSEVKKLPEIVENTKDWNDAVANLVKYKDTMNERIAGFRSKRHLSDENAIKMVIEANKIILEQQKSLNQ